MIIELGKKFIHDGVIYSCVGHDNKMCWGVKEVNSIEEAIPFDFDNCILVNNLPILGVDYCCDACM